MKTLNNNKATEIPVWFDKKLKFLGKWINNGENLCEIIDFNITDNTCKVEIITPTSEWVEDDWNLQHTIWGFNNGDYKRI